SLPRAIGDEDLGDQSIRTLSPGHEDEPGAESQDGAGTAPYRLGRQDLPGARPRAVAAPGGATLVGWGSLKDARALPAGQEVGRDIAGERGDSAGALGRSVGPPELCPSSVSRPGKDLEEQEILDPDPGVSEGRGYLIRREFEEPGGPLGPAIARPQ